MKSGILPFDQFNRAKGQSDANVIDFPFQEIGWIKLRKRSQVVPIENPDLVTFAADDLFVAEFTEQSAVNRVGFAGRSDS